MRYIFKVRCEATYFPKIHLGTRLVPIFGHMNIQKYVYMNLPHSFAHLERVQKTYLEACLEPSEAIYDF